MSRDNWERLVAAVLKKEQLWQLFHQDSISTISSDITTEFTEEILDFYSSNLEQISAYPSPSPQVPRTSPSISQVSNHASSGPITRKLFSAWHRRRKSVDEYMVNIPEHLRIQLGRLRRFSLHELQVATENFSNKNVFEHGDNKVYKGWLTDGSAVVVKGYKDKGFLTAQIQFQKEVEVNSITTHPNVLHVLGFCITEKEWLLVYPLMVNGSVKSWLRGRPESLPPLNLPIRKRIALGAARALAHLHYECDKKIIYRNIKAANILLDEHFQAVVANFDNAETVDCNDTHATTAVVVTFGYIAPEYLATGVCSVKTDVYGYGIFLLELITGQRPFELARLVNSDDVLLLDWVKSLLQRGKWQLIVDPDCENEVDVVAVQLMQISLLCTQSNPEERPKMPDVVSMLELEDGMPGEWYEVQKHWCKQEMSLPEVTTYLTACDDSIPDEIFDSPR